jgi:hypothetical protein
MAVKFQQGLFKMNNPTRYIGKHVPRYRSGWELKFMRFCDTHPSVVAWASESHRIPYYHPIKNKQTHYKKRHAEFIEIKPASQILGNAKSTAQKAQAIVNEAKWQAAKMFAQRQGVGFRVLTENELFNHPQRPKKKR